MPDLGTIQRPAVSANHKVAEDLNASLDRLAAQFGFRYTPDPLDFLQPAAGIAQRKAAQLKLFLDARKAAAREQAPAALLSGVALAGTNPSPQELAAFKPGLPSVLDLSMPASATPPATGNPPVLTPSETPEGQRFSQIEDAIRRNAPAVAAAQRSLTLHDAGLDESKIANARLRGGQADEQDDRFQAIKEIVDNPDIHPLLRADILQKKTVFKSTREIHRKGEIDYYMDATPNLSGGYDYTQARDAAGQPLQAPAGTRLAGGDKATALQKNAAFIARALFAGDPDAEQKAVTMLTQLKGKSPSDAWAALVQHVTRLDYGTYVSDHKALYDKTAEIWRVSRPGEPIPAGVRPASVPAPGATPGSPAPAAKPAAGGSDAYSQARAAIARGANPEAVKARLKQMGHDPGKL